MLGNLVLTMTIIKILINYNTTIVTQKKQKSIIDSNLQLTTIAPCHGPQSDLKKKTIASTKEQKNYLK